MNSFGDCKISRKEEHFRGSVKTVVFVKLIIQNMFCMSNVLRSAGSCANAHVEAHGRRRTLVQKKAGAVQQQQSTRASRSSYFRTWITRPTATCILAMRLTCGKFLLTSVSAFLEAPHLTICLICLPAHLQDIPVSLATSASATRSHASRGGQSTELASSGPHDTRLANL